MTEIYMITLKTVRASGVSVHLFSPIEVVDLVQSSLLRYHALMALCKSLTTAKRAVPEAAFKDILKQMKAALMDKSLPVQRAAANVRDVDVCASRILNSS